MGLAPPPWKTTTATETQANISDTHSRVMLKNSRKTPSMTTSGESRKEARSSINSQRNSRKKTTSTTHKRSAMAKPRISDLVTSEEVNENKRKPQNYTKQYLSLATWNVTSLVSNSSKYHQLVTVLDLYKIDLLGITETHIPYSGESILPNGDLFLYSGREDGKHSEGVGLTIAKRLKGSLISSIPHSSRILSARLHSKQVNITIIVAYAPTEVSNSEDKTAFYKELDAVHNQIPRGDMRLLIGDFNAQVGNNHEAWHGVTGKHSLHTQENNNGKRLLDFCCLNEYVIGGTLFVHKDIHKGTWMSPTGKTVNQIDHICVNKKWCSSLQDVRSYRGADINTTHYLVRGKLKLKLSTQHRKPQTRKPDLQKLRSGEKVEQFCSQLEILRSQSNTDSLEEEWSNFKSAYNNTSIEVLGTQPRRRKEQITSKETKDLLKERRKVKQQQPSDSNRAKYSHLNKQVRKSAKHDENQWASSIASKLEQAANKGDQRDVWANIRVLSKKPKKRTSAVRDKHGDFITDPSLKVQRWKEHFQELLNPEAPQDELPPANCTTNFFSDLPLTSPTLKEIQDLLPKLKNYKSPGFEGITNEEIKYGNETSALWLHNIYGRVWDEVQVPEDWLKGVIIILDKKGDISYCKNNRGITLRSTASKLFQMVILTRLDTCIENLLRDNQCGFRKNRSCADQLFSLRHMIEASIEYNLPMKINFIDFKAAFDSVRRDYIWQALHHYGLPTKYINIFRAFYSNTQSAVRVGESLTDWFEVAYGTGQGDIQAPPLFNIVLNWALEQAMSNKTISSGFTLQHRQSSRQPARHVTDADYADDLGVLDDSVIGLQESTDLITHHCRKAGLQINVGKTKVMSIDKNINQQPFPEHACLNIKINGIPLEQVTTFVYLGSTLACNGSIDPELSHRICKASGAFNSLNKIWHNRCIKIETKTRIYESAVLTILLYGSETWQTTMKQIHRLEVFHQSCLRRILRIRFFHQIRNVDVLQRIKISSIRVLLAIKRLKWYGHVVRMNNSRLPKYLLDWYPKHGHRSVGRQRTTWIKCVEEDLELLSGRVGITHQQGQTMAADRKRWSTMLRKGKENFAEQPDSLGDEG